MCLRHPTRVVLIVILLAASLKVSAAFSTSLNAKSVVEVTVRRALDANAAEAKNAWLQFHYLAGGGLPIIIRHQDGDGATKIIDRTIYPVLMKERATLSDESNSIEYTVTDPGPAYSDVVDGSHSGSVLFTTCDGSDGCEMVWTVRFQVLKWKPFYQLLTEWTLSTAANTVKEATATPKVFTATANINAQVSPDAARREWLAFIWSSEGGGLPLLPPLFFGNKVLVDEAALEKLIRIPPLITEQVVATRANESSAEIQYQLETATGSVKAWLNTPFLLHTHIGRVIFTAATDGTIDVLWEVEARPFAVAEALVLKLTEMTVSTLIRNLQTRMQCPGKVVEIGDSLGEVPIESWLGGVLDARLTDKRSTLEQTITLFQPWKWGRGDDDSVEYQWR